MIALLLFVGFFSVAAVAIYFNDVEPVRQSFISIFLIVLIICGTTGLVVWPFFSWHLYGDARSEDRTFYKLQVVGENGTELPYDARAVPPALATPIRRHARELATRYPPGEQRRFGCFLLQNAAAYRYDRLSGDSISISALKFPRHQYGVHWSKQQARNLGRVRAITVQRRDVVLSERGTSTVAERTTEVYRLSRTRCS